jgi:Spy/CpxP family protein refolding chaperone
MKLISRIALVSLVLVAATSAEATPHAWAAPPGVSGTEIGGSGPPSPPSFLLQLFPPKLIMENQNEISLRPEQVKAIKQAMTAAQSQLVDLQWELDAATEALGKLVAGDKVNEGAALEKLEQVTALEQKVKTANLTLLIRIKNVLDAEQQSKLRSMRFERRIGGPGGHSGGHGGPVPGGPNGPTGMPPPR